MAHCLSAFCNARPLSACDAAWMRAVLASITTPSDAVEEEPGLDMGATSKKLAEMWKTATDEQKALYQVLMSLCRMLHMACEATQRASAAAK